MLYDRARQGCYIQTKKLTSRPNDPLEQEAEQVADHIMRLPDPGLYREPATQSPKSKLDYFTHHQGQTVVLRIIQTILL